MSRFAQVYEPVEEGWGITLMRSLMFLGGGPVGLAVGSRISLPYKLAGLISNSNLSKMLKHPKMQKYLLDECNKLLKEEQKKDKSVTGKVPSNPIAALKRWWHNNDEVGMFSKSNLMNFKDDWMDDMFFDLKVGEFTTTFWYDTDHIDAAIVLFYSKDTGTCFARRIPAPSNAELKSMFHEE